MSDQLLCRLTGRMEMTEEAEDAWFSAVWMRDAERVRSLCQSTPDLHLAEIRNKDLNTVLHIACYVETSAEEMVTTLLDHAKDVPALLQSVNRYGESPLTMASTFNRLDVVRLLLDRGADPSYPSSAGSIPSDSVPLLRAIRLKCIDITRLLLERGADVHARDGEGLNALHYLNNKTALDLLLSYGADINAVDNRGRSALFGAIKGKYAVHLISRGADVKIRDHDGHDWLYVALSGWSSSQRSSSLIQYLDALLLISPSIKIDLQFLELISIEDKGKKDKVMAHPLIRRQVLWRERRSLMLFRQGILVQAASLASSSSKRSSRSRSHVVVREVLTSDELIRQVIGYL